MKLINRSTIFNPLEVLGEVTCDKCGAKMEITLGDCRIESTKPGTTRVVVNCVDCTRMTPVSETLISLERCKNRDEYEKAKASKQPIKCDYD